MSSSSSSFEAKWLYDVFLSFRGEDVRRGFLADLHRCLLHRGINAYIDSEDLRRGDEISPALMKAIEESRIAVLVFSEDYASSRWCLDELVKIMECRRLKKQRVMPVFYKVEPGVIRGQRESYGKALASHEKKLGQDPERVKKWREALTEAGNLSGWHHDHGDDTKFIESIVKEISTIVARVPLSVAKYPVGLGCRVEKVMSLSSLGSDDVRMIGIWGTGGVGKTTTAKAVCKSIADQFDGCSFVANVRETSNRPGGLVDLQKTLLSQILWKENLVVLSVDGGANLIRDMLCCRKILLVLDDVDDVEQLNALARECEWFGKGSRIIVTTRDKHVLTSHGIDLVYKVEPLDQVEAFELMSSHAFPRNQTKDTHRDLIYNILGYANGLPLAIVVLGPLLCGRSREEWESTLKKLAESPNKKINSILKISFDALEDNERDIFLDIACFFKGRERDYVTRVLDSCGLHTSIGIQTLIERSLVTISDWGIVQMHDLIQLMGQDTVKQEIPNYPGRRSRLWCYDDVYEVLSEATGTEAVRGIVLQLPTQKVLDISPNAFTHMRRLKVLILSNAQISGGLVCPPDDLRWLELHGCHSSTLKFSAHPKKLVCFDVRGNPIKKFEGNFEDFKNLKFLYFYGCLSMVCMPNFDFCPNLEELDLSGCKNLKHAHESVAYHAKLRLLNLRGCSNLHHFPDILQPKNLQVLDLCGCSKLRRFPDIPEKMKCLRELLLDETSIEELPASIENLVSLKILDLFNCKKLANLPSSIYKLPNLESLQLDGCSKLIKFPKEEEDSSDLRGKRGFSKLQSLCLGRCNLQEVEFLENHSCFSSLKNLGLSGNKFAKLPPCGHLHNLLQLDVSECRQLQEIGKVSEQLLKLQAGNCESLSKIPSDILSVNRLFRDSVRSERSCELNYISHWARLQQETILLGGEMPQWLLPNKEGYISFTASKDLYEKFLKLAICVVLRVKEEKQMGIELSSYTNGRCRHKSFGPWELPILHSEHVLLQLHAMDLWEVNPFGRNDSSSFQLGIKALDGVIVKKCGFRLICKPLEDDLEALNQDDELLDPSLLYEIGHPDEQTTREEEISADLSDLEKRGINHEDNYQTSSKEGDDMDDPPPVDIMADFSVELSLNEDNHQSRSEANCPSERETDEEILGDMSRSGLSVEKWRYSEIAPHYMDILSGGDMPKEFIIVEGSTISFMVSQDFYDKFLGLALCVVFTVEDGKKEIFFNIVPHLNGQRRNGLSGSLGSFNSNHMWIQYLKSNVLWGVLEGAIDFLEFDEDCLRFSLTLSVSGGTVKKLGYVLRCKQIDDNLKVVLKDEQLVNPASIYEMKLKEFYYKFLPRQMERMEDWYRHKYWLKCWYSKNGPNGYNTDSDSETD